MKAWKQVAVVAVAALGSSSVNAALLTFEDGNNGVASVDNKAITDDYQAEAGVVFATGTGTDYANFSGVAYLEQMGVQVGENKSTSGFKHDSDYDAVAAGVGLDGLTLSQRESYMGDYFLRTTSFSTESLVVVYDEAVNWAGFEIWDIDGSPDVNPEDPNLTEEWTITAYNGWGNQVFQIVTSSVDNNLDSTSYDGQRYVVELGENSTQYEFDRFVVEFTGTKTADVGLAFNNFSTNSIPEPASLAMLLATGAGVFCVRRVFKM